jgi:hypothetical protein
MHIEPVARTGESAYDTNGGKKTGKNSILKGK